MPVVSLRPSSLLMVSHLLTLIPRFPNILVLLSRVRLLLSRCVRRASWLKEEYRLLRDLNRLLGFGRVSLAVR